MSRSSLLGGNPAAGRNAAANQWSALAQSGISAILPAAMPHYTMPSMPSVEQEEEIPPDRIPIHGNQETG